MRIIKNRQCVDVLCNKCGKSCSNYFYQPPDKEDWVGSQDGLIEAYAHGGYSSNILGDCTKYYFSLCEKCCDDLFKTFNIPVKVVPRQDYHPRQHIDYYDKYWEDEPESFEYMNDDFHGVSSNYYKFKVGEWVVKKNSQEKGRIYNHCIGGTFWEDYKKDFDNHEYNYRKENRIYEVGFKWFVNQIDSGQIRYEYLEEDEIELKL